MMMSALPLKPSNNNNIECSKWYELTKLAEQLLLQTDLESQLLCLTSTFERYFAGNTLLWLSDSFSNLMWGKVLQEIVLRLSSLTELMRKTYEERRVFGSPIPDSNISNLPTIIAIPLIIGDDVLGVIQLERENHAGFDNQDVEFIRSLVLQASIVLDWKRQESIYSNQQKNNEILNSIAQIGKSITSNLDLDNLLNSAVTLIHQNLGFVKVNIYTLKGEKIPVLTGVGISPQGIEPRIVYCNENDRWSSH